MIDAHRGAFEYEWRARFSLSISKIGTSAMSWGEAVRLTNVLRSDPASYVAAAIEGWAYPVRREAIILADLFDLQHRSKAKKKPDPYPRPWAQENRRTFGRTRLSKEQLRAILDAHRNS